MGTSQGEGYLGDKKERREGERKSEDSTSFHFVRGSHFYYEAEMSYFEKVVYPF